jgi:hypothetical protein
MFAVKSQNAAVMLQPGCNIEKSFGFAVDLSSI